MPLFCSVPVNTPPVLPIRPLALGPRVLRLSCKRTALDDVLVLRFWCCCWCSGLESYLHSNDLHSTSLHLQTPFIQRGRAVCDPTRLCVSQLLPPILVLGLRPRSLDTQVFKKRPRPEKAELPFTSILLICLASLDAFLKHLGCWS